MKVWAIDCETTIKSNASPFAEGNENGLVCWSYASQSQSQAELWNGPKAVQDLLSSCSLVVGFNFKFDYNWLSHHGVDFSNVRIWDVQLAEFIISNQLWKFPSLNGTAERYGIPTKLDIVKTEYWEKGIDTSDIPWDVLSEYAAHDAHITLLCYYAQLKYMTPGQIMLCRLMCQDMKVLAEMERNGLLYDEALCKQKEQELDAEIKTLTEQLAATYPHIPINFGSNDNLSAFLYGGKIIEQTKEPCGVFKTGARAGQIKLKNVEIEHLLPQMFKPIKGSEREKEGYYKTSTDILRKLKGRRQKVLETLLRLSKIEKLRSTYYVGLPLLNREMNWPEGILHSQLNQTLAATGRLTSSKPNQQNFASEIQDVFVSRYD